MGGKGLTNRFHAALPLFSKRSPLTSNCGKRKSDTPQGRDNIFNFKSCCCHKHHDNSFSLYQIFMNMGNKNSCNF